MRAVTAAEMQSIDKETIENYGLSGAILMERAGLSVCQRVLELYPHHKFAVLCGRGNNGGDGFVAARELSNKGRRVSVYLLAEQGAVSGDALIHLNIAKAYAVPLLESKAFFQDYHKLKSSHTVIIDALFGTGLTRDINGIYGEVINLVNEGSRPVVSVDIPSGICSDTGLIRRSAIKATHTVTFGLPKIGHLMNPGASHTGQLFIEDIGFPSNLMAGHTNSTILIDSPFASAIAPLRPVDSSKRDYGHVLLLAGSRGKTGAALMAARAALRSGCGLVTIASPSSVIDSMQGSLIEEMSLPLKEDKSGRISSSATDTLLNFIEKRVSVLAIGPGLGLSPEITDTVKSLIANAPVPIVLDADGLNALNANNDKDVLRRAKTPVVITPHKGEMARLLNVDAIAEPISAARQFSLHYRTITLLKGAPTIIATLDGRLYINSTGNQGMATAGSGDVLTGVAASLIAQGLMPEHAAAFAVFLHGLSGDYAAGQKGLHSLIASDIINHLPEAFKTTFKTNWNHRQA